MIASENKVQDVDAYEFGDFCLYTGGNSNNRLRRSAKPFHLRPREFSLLCILVENHGMEVSWEDLCKGVWGEKAPELKQIQNNLHKQVSNLKDSLDDDKIITKTDNGYRLAVEVVEIRYPNGSSDDIEFTTWVFRNRTGRTLVIRFGAGIAITILYLISYYSYIEQLK